MALRDSLPLFVFADFVAIVVCVLLSTFVACAIAISSGGVPQPVLVPGSAEFVLDDGRRIEARTPAEVERVQRIHRGHIRTARLGTKGLDPRTLRALLVPSFVGMQLAMLLYPLAIRRGHVLRWLKADGATLLWGVGGGLALLLCSVATSVAMRAAGVEVPDMVRMLLDMLPPWILFLLAVVLAPVGEELYFRGHLLEGIARRSNPVVAIAITSLAFAVVHGQVLLFATYLTYGVILAMLRLRTGGLTAPILAHLINNLTAIMAGRFAPDAGF